MYEAVGMESFTTLLLVIITHAFCFLRTPDSCVIRHASKKQGTFHFSRSNNNGNWKLLSSYSDWIMVYVHSALHEFILTHPSRTPVMYAVLWFPLSRRGNQMYSHFKVLKTKQNKTQKLLTELWTLVGFYWFFN